MADENLTLSDVNAAISKILAGGQEYTIGSRRLRRADLDKLLALRDQLAGADAADESLPLMPGVAVSVFDRR